MLKEKNLLNDQFLMSQVNKGHEQKELNYVYSMYAKFEIHNCK